MFDDDITVLCFNTLDDKDKISKMFPNMRLAKRNLLFKYLRDGQSPIVIKNGEVIDPKSEDNIIIQKEEFKKRFSFIYENSKALIEFGCPINGHLGFNFLKWLEECLLGNKPLEETYLYKIFTKEKESNEVGYEDYSSLKVQHYIWNRARVIGEHSKDMWELLSHLVYYIYSRNDISSYNNTKELEALDEYFRVLRYSNDGIKWVSGYSLVGEDLTHALFLIQAEREEMVNYYDNPEFEGNEFLSCFASSANGKDSVHLTEKEKQELYLKYHDELPWDFVFKCKKNKNINLPEICVPCGKDVLVLEKDIFSDENCNFHCMCDKCGYIISIPKEGINSRVVSRIQERRLLNRDLFRKMVLYSELQALDRDSDIKVLEKIDDIERIDEIGKRSYIMSRFKNKGGK